ncbi:unnamed protein product [Meganyctiphanes norvegica]|uniref:Leucine-rich repeat domain, L domain-containing protein n=1 Tax=Meganyctiphanes norvegica TaxID=48144 RepID=A0AAV2QJA6_MEGNR
MLVDIELADCDNDKIELTTDVWVRDDEDLQAMWDIIELSKQPEFGVIVYFRNVSFFMLSSHLVTQLFQPLGNIKTSYFDVLSCGFSDDTLQNLSIDLPYLLGLSLTSCPQITNLHPLTSMFNLEQLSLANINLNGMLGPLCSLRKGLYYLNLARCNLSHKELDMLCNSVHSASVRQLNLSANDFSSECDFTCLVSLCNKLKSVEVLVLRNCRLHMGNGKLVNAFFCSLKELYSLCLLRLEYNDFSCYILTSYLVKIEANPSLRCVSLGIPTDISNEAEKIKELRNHVHELMNKRPESHICVTWQRPSSVLLV